MEFSDEFTLDKLNDHYVKLQPLPKHELNLCKTKATFNFNIVTSKEILKEISNNKR